MKLKYISFTLVVLFLFVAIQPKAVTFANSGKLKPQDCMKLFFSDVSVGNELRHNALSIDTYINNMSMYYLSKTGRSMDYILLGMPCDSYKDGDTLHYSDGLVYFLFCYDSEDVVTYENGVFYYNGVEMYKNGASYDCTACTAYYGISVDTYKDEPYVNNGTGHFNSGSSLLTSTTPYKLNDLLKDSVLKIASNVKGFSDFNKVVNDFDDLNDGDFYFLSPKEGAKIKSVFDKNYKLDFKAIAKMPYLYDGDIFDDLGIFLGVTNHNLCCEDLLKSNSVLSIEYVLKEKYRGKIDETVEYVGYRSFKKDGIDYDEEFIVEVNGDIEDWIDDKTINFAIEGNIFLNKELCKKSDYIILNLTCPVYDIGGPLTGDGSNITSFKKMNTVPVKIALQTLKDTNSDGVDDFTGEKIDSNIMYDDNGDGDFEDQTNLGAGDGDENQTFFEWLTSLVEDVKDFFTSCCKTLKSIVQNTSQMATSIWQFFDFLPNPIPNLIKTGFVLIILVTIIRYIRG